LQKIGGGAPRLLGLHFPSSYPCARCRHPKTGITSMNGPHVT